jgi:hypothetical protein
MRKKFRLLMLTPSRRTTKTELNIINTTIGIFRAFERSSSGRFGGAFDVCVAMTVRANPVMVARGTGEGVKLTGYLVGLMVRRGTQGKQVVARAEAQAIFLSANCD